LNSYLKNTIEARLETSISAARVLELGFVF